MEVQEVKDKLDQVVRLLDELIPELDGTTTIGVITQQVHTELVQNRRAVGIVLNNVLEAEKAQQDQQTKDDLPEKAPSPASKADRSRS